MKVVQKLSLHKKHKIDILKSIIKWGVLEKTENNRPKIGIGLQRVTKILESV